MNYLWAVNKVKLQQSEAALTKRKLLDARVDISEETIKEEYIKRAGLIRDEKDFIHAPDAPAKQPLKGKTVDELKSLAEEWNVDISACEDKKQLVKILEVEQSRRK